MQSKLDQSARKARTAKQPSCHVLLEVSRTTSLSLELARLPQELGERVGTSVE